MPNRSCAAPNGSKSVGGEEDLDRSVGGRPAALLTLHNRLAAYAALRVILIVRGAMRANP